MELSPAFAGAAAKVSATIATQQKQAPVRLMPPLRWRWVQIRFRRTSRDRVLAVLAYWLRRDRSMTRRALPPNAEPPWSKLGCETPLSRAAAVKLSVSAK